MNTTRLYQTPGGCAYDVYLNMLQQPHLLIAGTTGAGKSVVINALMYTALYKPPGAVTFILIDPKKVELSPFRYLPHAILYADEPPARLYAFQAAVKLTENRFTVMQRTGARKYCGGDCYIIVDEWADLITTQKTEILPLAQRLAQIGRAAKVHLIFATQTPIAKILPTEIKCNFDARLALRTRSAQDSRNIIGRTGPETLPRYGYGYYFTPERDIITPLPMYSDTEIQQRVDFWKAQQ